MTPSNRPRNFASLVRSASSARLRSMASAARRVACDCSTCSRESGSPGPAGRWPPTPSSLPLAPLMGIDQTARKPGIEHHLRGGRPSAHRWPRRRRTHRRPNRPRPRTSRGAARWACARAPPPASAAAAARWSAQKRLASGDSTEIVQRQRGYTACTSAGDHVEHRGQPGVGCQQREERALVLHDDLGALAFGDVGDAGAHQRLRRRPARRTRRTSQGMSRPVESRWIHSNTCDSPAAAQLQVLARRDRAAARRPASRR